MRTLLTTLIALALTSFVGGAAAQTVDQLPGYFALEDLDVFQPGEVEVDVDLRDSMIRAAASATEKDNEFKELLNGIRRVRVKVGTVGAGNPEAIRSTIDGAAAQLEGAGWYRMVTVRDDDETVYVLAIEGDGLIHGLTAMVFDDDGEVVLVNIAGEMEPEAVGRVISNLEDLEDLGVDIG